MKHILPICVFLLCSVLMYGQDISILLVDDSKDNFNNVDSIGNAITASGFTFDYYNAPDSTVGPGFSLLENYDLVIWHTSNDGVGLDLWNRLDEPNGDLTQYLLQGGNLWLIGLDFLYDRYDLAADTFAAGDFVYDYLGIAQYDAQSYVDDGGLGVPLVRPSADQPITGLADINWIFSTLWNADAITGVEGSTPIYEMGDDNYVFAGRTAGLWYDNGTSKALTFTFDLALAANADIRENTVSSVLNYFSAVLTDNKEVAKVTSNVQVYPNPVNVSTRISLELTQSTQVQMDILQNNGQLVQHFLAPSQLVAGTHQFDWTPAAVLPAGIYQIRIQAGQEIISKSVMIAR